MYDEFDVAQGDAAAQKGGMTRRSMVRTGAHLAWAVPAVSLATTAPALAVSGDHEEPVQPPPNGETTVEGSESPNGKKETFMVGFGEANRPLTGGDLIVTVKSKGKVGGNGGRNWDRAPSAASRRNEYTYVLATAVAAGSEVPSLKVNIKAFKKKGKKVLPKKSRYFVTDSATGEVVFTGVLQS